MISDDPVYAIDFAMKFDPGELTYFSFINHKPYLNVAANYNAADSTVRFSSFSFSQTIESNSTLITVQFNYGSVNQVSIATFDSIETQLNGDYCSRKGISAGLSPTVVPGGSPTITPGDSIQLSVALLPGQTGVWSTGATGPVTWVYSPGPYSVTVTNQNGCSGSSGIIINAPSPLPIQLIGFSGTASQKGIVLEWVTATETDNHFFTVEKSLNGFNWGTLATVLGAGNSNTVLSYTVTDSHPDEGINYYRLKQTDFNGNSTISEVIAVNYESSSLLEHALQVYPNPSPDGLLNIRFNCQSEWDKWTVKVTELNGREVYSEVISVKRLSGDSCSCNIRPRQPLSQGIYMVTVDHPTHTSQTLLMVR
jgi:hypothetical protein